MIFDKVTWWLLGQFIFCLVCYSLPILFPIRRRK
jgi:hypothetical protein